MPLTRPRRAALPILLAAALAAPASASAADQPVAEGPAEGAQVNAGTRVVLNARGVAGETGLALRISRTQGAIDSCSRINGDVANVAATPVSGEPGLFTFAAGPWFDEPGTYVWQVHRIATDGTCAAAAARTIVILPAPLPRLSRARIPSRIGSSNHVTFVIRTGGVPVGVSRSRYVSLVRNSGRRWRLRSVGRRPGRLRFGNGRSEVGFSTQLVPFGALAVTITGPRLHGGSGRERDLVLRADLPWQPGPAHPDRAQIDLETVLLHEFGHFAGNRGHVARGCSDTPMIVGLARGEWWRAPGDFSFRDCS